ncbi:MAG: RrF2 family transcriptional regulator [Pirellulales bacterium]|jgi:Rrf2 family protein
MKLSRTVAYALQATLQLAETNSPVPVPCSQLANKGEMPERFLLQVLRSLVTHGVLRSTRGVDGGYTLVRPATEISLLDIIEAIDGPMDTHLPLEGKINDTFKGNLQEAISGVTDSAKKQLSEIKISQLISLDTEKDGTSATTDGNRITEQMPTQS